MFTEGLCGTLLLLSGTLQAASQEHEGQKAKAAVAEPAKPPARPQQQGPDRRRPPRPPDRLKEGDPAPDFLLKTVDGKHQVRLSAYRGRQPVVLIFGSYT